MPSTTDYAHERVGGKKKIYNRYGRRMRGWGGTMCRIDPAVVRFQATISGQQKVLQHAKLLEHSFENRETVECISQFAMLFRVCNRQSP